MKSLRRTWEKSYENLTKFRKLGTRAVTWNLFGGCLLYCCCSCYNAVIFLLNNYENWIKCVFWFVINFDNIISGCCVTFCFKSAVFVSCLECIKTLASEHLVTLVMQHGTHYHTNYNLIVSLSLHNQPFLTAYYKFPAVVHDPWCYVVGVLSSDYCEPRLMKQFRVDGISNTLSIAITTFLPQYAFSVDTKQRRTINYAINSLIKCII